MLSPSSAKASRLVNMEDIDTPEVAPALRTFPAPKPAKQTEQSRLSGVPLDDVVESLSRSPTSASSSPKGSSRPHSAASSARNEASKTARQGRGYVRAASVDVDDGDASSTIPTEMDLYGRRRHHRSHCKHAHKSRSGSRQATKTTIVDVEIAHEKVDGDDDALLRKMKRKEKEFDSKIKEINHTFLNAGRQLVVRDDIIEHLQAELASMRSQEHHRTRAEEQKYRAKERELVDQCNATVNQVRQENEELRAALKECNERQAQQQKVMDQLMQQLTDTDAKTREMKRQHENKIDSIRTKCQEQLQEFDQKVSKMQRRCVELEADRDGLQGTHAQSQAKLLGLQMELAKEREGDSRAMKNLWKEKERFREEVEAVRLSMARLLQVMSEVPDLKDYLQWNELDSNFVFLGFPTRYFSLEGCRGGQGANHAGRNGHDESGGEEGNDFSVLPSGRLGTGVEDGMYTGTASFQDSKNVWLNGHWVRQLQEIINAENLYTRLKKIKLYELEEAGQVSSNLPNARDVLQCRRQEKDYWVPYAVFEEAQQFKNKYYPRVPALSHFYPFLTRLNRIWHRKLQDRVGTMRKDLQTAQQQLLAMKRLHGNNNNNNNVSSFPCCSYVSSPYQNSVSVSLEDWQSGHRESSRRDVSGCSYKRRPQRQHNEDRRAARVHLIGLSHAIAEWESQLEYLRRQVRLTITSQRSLQFFRVYSNLFTDCLATVKRFALRCQESEEESAFAADVSTTLRDGESSEEERRGRRHHSHRRLHEYSHSPSGSDEESRLSADEVQPLPPPRHHHHHHHSRNLSDQVMRSTTQQQQAKGSSFGALEEGNNEATESLLCVVQHSSERVCGVADYLAERTQACCNDLEALMAMLRDVYIPKIVAAQLAAAAAKAQRHDSVTTTPSSQASSTAASSLSGYRREKAGKHASTIPAEASTESSMTAIQKQIRDILRDQYGPGFVASVPPPGSHFAESDEKTKQEEEEPVGAAYLRAMKGMEREGEGGQRTTGISANTAAGAGTVLQNVVASVFDFSREVRSEVLQAQKALQVIATEAMKEAEDL